MAMGDIAFNLLIFFVILARAQDDSHLQWNPAQAEKVESAGHSMVSIVVDTDNRLAITGAIRKVLFENKEKFDPRDYLKPARAAMKQVCIDRMTAFGQAGNASKLSQSA